MRVLRQNKDRISYPQARTGAITLLVMIVLVLTIVAKPAAHAQTFNILHNFTGGSDGDRPGAGITRDRVGNFYGTTQYGGDFSCDAGGLPGCGALYKFQMTDVGPVLTPLHDFYEASEPFPEHPGVPTVGPDDGLYGVISLGGPSGDDVGTVFVANPLNSTQVPISSGLYRVLYQFTETSNDGSYPTALQPLQFDAAGNIYGATTYGGSENFGTVYELIRSGSNWTYSTLYSFLGGKDGARPRGIVFDDEGNIYGVAAGGGSLSGGCGNRGCGTVFELTPSQSGWTMTVLHSFQAGVDGGWPGPLIRDQAGNLYGLNTQWGPNNSGGTVWELSPSGGNWTASVLYAFPSAIVWDYGPYAPTIDAAGNLYGITDSNGYGLLFKLTPNGGSWTYTDLYDFGSNACTPQGAVLLDAASNIYGVTESCGEYGGGVIWEFTP
ncbi:MAG: choice-of-anchor tandem repeat GloVer-containing protein [Terriglobales bacterium]